MRFFKRHKPIKKTVPAKNVRPNTMATGLKEMNFPKIRVMFSLIFIGLYAVTASVFKLFEAPLTASVATNQVEDSVVTYSLVQTMIEGKVLQFFGISLLVMLLILWVPYLMKMMKNK